MEIETTLLFNAVAAVVLFVFFNKMIPLKTKSNQTEDVPQHAMSF